MDNFCSSPLFYSTKTPLTLWAEPGVHPVPSKSFYFEVHICLPSMQCAVHTCHSCQKRLDCCHGGCNNYQERELVLWALNAGCIAGGLYTQGACECDLPENHIMMQCAALTEAKAWLGTSPDALCEWIGSDIFYLILPVL